MQKHFSWLVPSFFSAKMAGGNSNKNVFPKDYTLEQQKKIDGLFEPMGKGSRSFCLWVIVAVFSVLVVPLSASSAQAGNMDLYLATGSLKGQRIHLKKPVTSIRERKFRNLVEQRFDFSCGAAAVATILKYAYNRDVDEIEVVEGMMKVSDEALVREKGFSLLDVRHYVETHGLRGRGYEVSASSLYELRIPTIVLLDIRGYKHFVVLRRVVGDQVYVGDPALGNRVMSMDDFLASWNKTIFAIVGNGFDRKTVLSQPEPPLTIGKLWYDRAPISDSELLDFGFQHAELF